MNSIFDKFIKIPEWKQPINMFIEFCCLMANFRGIPDKDENNVLYSSFHSMVIVDGTEKDNINLKKLRIKKAEKEILKILNNSIVRKYLVIPESTYPSTSEGEELYILKALAEKNNKYFDYVSEEKRGNDYWIPAHSFEGLNPTTENWEILVVEGWKR